MLSHSPHKLFSIEIFIKKKEVKPILIWWLSVLQKFSMEIKDEKGYEIVVANYFSSLVNEEEEDFLPIQEKFQDEQLFQVSA